MLIAILGLAGSGKSTQADLIAQKTGMVHLSVGQLLRETHQDHLEEYMKIGKLINPSVVNGLLKERLDSLKELSTTKGVILDGYPRQQAQAEWLMDHKDDYPLKLVVLVKTTVEESTKRLLARKRLDDNVEAIKNRLSLFKIETEPMIEYLKSQGIFVLEVDGLAPIEQVHQQIMEKLDYVLPTFEN